MKEQDGDLSDLGPFGRHFTQAWPEIAECFTHNWGKDVVKAQLVTGWSVLFRVKHEDAWRLKTWCDSEQSHLWACSDACIVAEMREALCLGTVPVALGRLADRQADDDSGALEQPHRWVRDSLQRVGASG